MMQKNNPTSPVSKALFLLSHDTMYRTRKTYHQYDDNIQNVSIAFKLMMITKTVSQKKQR